MTHEEIRVRLEDYVDGLLPEAEIREVEGHLAGCVECREEVAAQRSLLSDLAALPEVAPGRDLWPEISERMDGGRVVAVAFGETGRRPARQRWGVLAAAAVALMALSSVITALLIRNRPEALIAGSERVAYARTALREGTELDVLEAAYGRVIEDLTEALRERRHTLSPETARVIEANLRIIDEALRASRAALAADPGNQKLIHAVSDMYEEKVALLEQVTRLPTGI